MFDLAEGDQQPGQRKKSFGKELLKKNSLCITEMLKKRSYYWCAKWDKTCQKRVSVITGLSRLFSFVCHIKGLNVLITVVFFSSIIESESHL